MPKTVEVKLYQFNELSDKAKEKARDWWRECEAQDFEVEYEDFETIAEILGVEIRQRSYTTPNGKTGYEPAIYWQLHRQGSGASFEGSYSYAEDCSKKIREYAGEDKELHRIADELTALQEKHGNKLSAKIVVHGNDSAHEYAMDLEEAYDGEDYCDGETEKALLGLMRSLARWLYKYIDEEYDYRMSDENVDESIQINKYWFRENGERSDG